MVKVSNLQRLSSSEMLVEYPLPPPHPTGKKFGDIVLVDDDQLLLN